MGFKYRRSDKLESLLGILRDFSDSDRIMFGQQNCGHIGVSIDATDGTESDCKNLTGSHPAVAGIDTLSFLGYEGKMSDLVTVVKNLRRQGLIITLSSHMPNFTLGGYEFYDYSPNYTDGDCGKRIMPGGDLNDKYKRFLDMIAEFASLCIDVEGEKIPMIFRPFHECNGDEDEYLARYPGDEYIDIMGLDLYNDKPHKGDGFFHKLSSSIDVVYDIAKSRSKITALTEIGYRSLETENGYFEGLAPIDNTIRDWFTELLDGVTSTEGGRRLSYMLTWANFSDTQFWIPFATEDFRHEMADDFIKFTEDHRIKMAPVFDFN